MKDSLFIRGKVPMTKEEIRAISIDKLNLKNKGSFIDVGAGTGSISIQVALSNPDMNIIAIEKNEDGIDIINKNIEKFDIKNINVINAFAPINDISEKIEGAFIGGSSKNMLEIVKWLKSILKEDSFLVINCILIESMNEALIILNDENFEDIDVCMVSINRLEKLGSGNYFKPLNPAYIISAKRGKYIE